MILHKFKYIQSSSGLQWLQFCDFMLPTHSLTFIWNKESQCCYGSLHRPMPLKDFSHCKFCHLSMWRTMRRIYSHPLLVLKGGFKFLLCAILERKVLWNKIPQKFLIQTKQRILAQQKKICFRMSFILFFPVGISEYPNSKIKTIFLSLVWQH
jgi:hypothetical protein